MTDIDLSPEAGRKYLIRKHGAWYRPGSSGYTGSAIQAGRYTLSEAERITHPNGKDGPRDGMRYVHEDEVQCDDLKAFRALSARVEELEAQLIRAKTGLVLARDELDQYYRREYPLDHVVHERGRQRDYDTNPARLALDAITPPADPAKEVE